MAATTSFLGNVTLFKNARAVREVRARAAQRPLCRCRPATVAPAPVPRRRAAPAQRRAPAPRPRRR